MTRKIFVGNLPFQLDDIELEDLFKEYGEVSSAKVVVDRRTGRSKGYGFVEMGAEDNAQQAVEALNGAEVKGRLINVSFARNQGENGGEKDFSARDRDYGGYRRDRFN